MATSGQLHEPAFLLRTPALDGKLFRVQSQACSLHTVCDQDLTLEHLCGIPLFTHQARGNLRVDPMRRVVAAERDLKEHGSFSYLKACDGLLVLQ